MDELLFLAHRIPYPPDKGDKIRSWHFLQHLAERYRVHLGCFIDDPRDWQFRDTLRGLCKECCFVPLDPRRARLRSLFGLLDGRALTLPYYSSRILRRWVTGVLARPDVAKVFVYCSAMAQYVPRDLDRRCVVDLVDVDSEKWIHYARGAQPPASWLWRREGRLLREVEREITATAARTLVATQPELDLLRKIAPDSAGKTAFVTNGVDTDYFSPDRIYELPPGMNGRAVVFTGAMDYRPNVDAALFFAGSVMPLLRRLIPEIKFYVVGSNPRPELLALAERDGIAVTGRVADVRPYLAHADVVVAPLRIARGIQNKVLEAMAMAKPVVASREALVGIDLDPQTEACVAADADAFATAVHRIVTTGVGKVMGLSARRRVLADYEWRVSLGRLDAFLEASIP